MKLSLIIIVALAPITMACATAVGSGEGGDAGTSTSKDAGSSKDSGTTKKDSGSSTTDDSGTVGPTDDAGNPMDDSTCDGLSTKGQCEQCCLKVHPTGYDVYHQALNDCTCTSPGACATECANEACANKPTTPGGACEQCITASLGSSGACYNGVANACQADSDCTTLFSTCIPPCESK